MTNGPLNVVGWGEGDRVICVHGSLSWGTFAFRAQRPLATSHSLVLPDRRGYGASPGTGRADFAVDADDITALLHDGAHLVGHSYGAVVVLLVAARHPEAVRTLTVVEPAALSVARGDPAVEELIATLGDVHAAASGLSPPEFTLRFREAFGYRRGVDMSEWPKLNAKGLRAAATTMTERPPWEAEIRLDALASAGVPALIVSGRWDNLAVGEQALGRRAFGAVCDTLMQSLAGRRVVIDGWAHGCQYSGEPFNDALRSFWKSGAGPLSAGPRTGLARRETLVGAARVGDRVRAQRQLTVSGLDQDVPGAQALERAGELPQPTFDDRGRQAFGSHHSVGRIGRQRR